MIEKHSILQETAINKYILFNLNAHNLILNYLEKIINLPKILIKRKPLALAMGMNFYFS